MKSPSHPLITPAMTRVQQPLLPTAAEIAPYLERIDASRWYSNRGPLLWELEERLSAHFGVTQHALVLLSSGTAALEAAILAHAGEGGADRPLALLPSYTFAATALAAIRCGYRPHFLDVDAARWMLDPEAVADHPLMAQAGLILPVAAYGRRPDMAAWEAVQARTGCPVVIDAAAAFEQIERDADLISSELPLVLSLHATKSFSTAEGGAVLWRSVEGLLRVGRITNFGMDDTRRCEDIGFNGKLSEYHAAVGLAQLDGWARRQARLADLAEIYRTGFAAAGGIEAAGRLRLPPELSGAYVLFEAATGAQANQICTALDDAGIAHRRWYGHGLHREPVHVRGTADPMPITEDLGRRHIGLPAAVDLDAPAIARLAEVIARTIETIARQT